MLDTLANSVHAGVKGVRLYEGAWAGPTVGIGVATHGNEQEGLAALELLDANPPKVGNVMVFLCNPAAAREQVRYVDHDMNRLPEDMEGEGIELARARELRPLLEKVNYGLDIHSTPGPTEPMLIPIRGEHRCHQVALGMGVKVVIDGLPKHQVGRPLSSWFGPALEDSLEDPLRAAAGPVVLGLEVGQQGTETARKAARLAIEAFLHNTGPYPPLKRESEAPARYRVTGAVHFTDPTCKFLPRLLSGSEADLRRGTAPHVEKGEVIAYGENGSVVSPGTGFLLFPRREPSALATEAAFIAKKTETSRVPEP